MKLITLLRLCESSRDLHTMFPIIGPSSGAKETELDGEFAEALVTLAADREKRTLFRHTLYKQRRAIQELIDGDV